MRRTFVLGLLASLALLATGPQASAEFTTIYSDNFDGDATTLNGRVTPVGSGTWQFNSPTSFAEAYLSNGMMNGGGGPTDGRVAALLPFTPQEGNIYRLKGTISATDPSGNGQWAGLGFADALEGASGLFAFGDINGNPWMLRNAWAAVQGFAGPQNQNILFQTESSLAELQIELDTTELAWKTTMFLNGTQRGNTFTYTTNPTIVGVGFTKVDVVSGSVGAFSLEVQPVPGPTGDIVLNVASGTQTQAEAGYPTISAATSVTKTGAGTIVFDAANAYTGPTTVSAGTLQVANAAGLAATNVTVDTGATLAVAAGTTMTAPSVIVDGGTLSAANLAVNNTTGITALAINAGTLADSPTVTVGPGGQMSLVQDARVSVAVGELSVDQAGGGGRLDLGAGQVTIAAGGISSADLRADIIAGRNGGAWNGATGITSSTAASSGGTRGVGYVVADDGSAKVSFAAAGDVDLSGAVNVFDLVGINSSGKYGTGGSSVWSQGDFNYDGVTNVFDLVGVNTAGSYGQGNYFPATPSAAGLGSVSVVPEPGVSLVAVGSLVGLAIARRRRRS
jgi:autotransporter-associated beta strand protein